MTPAPGTDGLGDNMLVGAVKEGDEGVGGFEAVEAELGEGGEAGVRGGGGGAGEGGEVGDGVVDGRGGERGGDAEVVVSLVGGGLVCCWLGGGAVRGGGEGLLESLPLPHRLRDAGGTGGHLAQLGAAFMVGWGGGGQASCVCAFSHSDNVW